MQRENVYQDNTTNINIQMDPVQAIEKIIEENRQLKEEKKKLQIENQKLTESIEIHKIQLKSLEANRGSMAATEIEKLKKELAHAKKELRVLKTDIENFKS